MQKQRGNNEMTTEHNRFNEKICFITSTGHSGSTLLGFILGSHPTGFYLGEGENLMKVGCFHEPLRKRTCRLCGPICAVWQDFAPDNSIDIYEQVALKTKKTMLIDSSKVTEYCYEQIQALEDTTVSLFLIWLCRDGRAVFNSFIRRYPETPPPVLVQRWIKETQRARSFYQSFSGEKIKIHYEKLASEPEVTVKMLCQFLEISYFPDMLNFCQHDHHPLGGNNGTQLLVANAKNADSAHLEERLCQSNQVYYLQHPSDIKPDLRWQQELAPEMKQLFYEMVGSLNYEFEWK
jgi:hypothetical protein